MQVTKREQTHSPLEHCMNACKQRQLEETGGYPGPVNRSERFDLAPDPCVFTNLNFQIRKVNIAGLNMFGQTLAFLERMPFFQFISLSDRQAVVGLSMALLRGAGDGAEPIEITVVPPRRTEVTCAAEVTLMRNSSGEPVGFLWLMRTVPVQMTAEETLQLSQRMDELSGLAHSLVHEFRNIFTAIQINAEIIGMARSRRDRQESVDEIRKGCEKAATLLRQFRAFRSDSEGVVAQLPDARD